jgi:hypothetical protein
LAFRLLVESSYVVIWLQKGILKEKWIEDVFGCVWGGTWIGLGKPDGIVDSVCQMVEEADEY